MRTLTIIKNFAIYLVLFLIAYAGINYIAHEATQQNYSQKTTQQNYDLDQPSVSIVPPDNSGIAPTPAPTRSTVHSAPTPDPIKAISNTVQSTNVTSGMGIQLLTITSIDNNGKISYKKRSCSLGPVINDTTALTAGHCIQGDNDVVIDTNNNVLIGKVVSSKYGDNSDAALIELSDNLNTEDITVDRLSFVTPQYQEPMSKTGFTTGTTYGYMKEPLTEAKTIDGHNITVATTNMCALPGDSGGVVKNQNGEAVGIISNYQNIYAETDDQQQCAADNIIMGYVPIDNAFTYFNLYGDKQ